MQLQFRNFPELFVYTVTVPFSLGGFFLLQVVRLQAPALPPAALSSLVPLILGKSSGSGCTARKKNSTFGCRANKPTGKKTALFGA